MPVCPECLAQLDSMYVSGSWKCNAGFGDGSGWKPVPANLAAKMQLASPPRPPQSRSILTRVMTYLASGLAVVAMCFVGALATAFAGSGHRNPAWLLPFLATTQALPLLLFFVSSWSMLHSIANRARFGRSSVVWRGSLAVYFGSWGLLFVLYVAFGVFQRDA
jgi:hypothetical protein